MSNPQPPCAPQAPSCLERSGAESRPDWLSEQAAVGGVALLRASLRQRAYARHRHDTYTIALTESGVQEFDYRRSVHRSLPGQTVVLHPDELHDGRPGTPDGFSYRSVYLDPARVHDAVRAAAGRAVALPFVENPVVDDPQLAAAVAGAFESRLEPLAALALIDTASAALMRAARQFPAPSRHRALSDGVLTRAREFLEANFARVVGASEIEAACGATRYAISANFKRRFGTSPYRYLLMRRLEHVRARLVDDASLAGLAQEAGFADQAHLTRMFKSAYGMTPSAFAALCRAGDPPPGAQIIRS